MAMRVYGRWRCKKCMYGNMVKGGRRRRAERRIALLILRENGLLGDLARRVQANERIYQLKKMAKVHRTRAEESSDGIQAAKETDAIVRAEIVAEMSAPVSIGSFAEAAGKIFSETATRVNYDAPPQTPPAPPPIVADPVADVMREQEKMRMSGTLVDKLGNLLANNHCARCGAEIEILATYSHRGEGPLCLECWRKAVGLG